MIILRQKIFVDVDNLASFYDENGDLKPFANDEDRRKHDVFKQMLEDLKDKKDSESQKKYKEYKEFIKNGNRKSSENSSSNSSSNSSHNQDSNDPIDKMVDDYQRSVRRAKGITWGTWGATIGNAMIRKNVKGSRKDEIDEITGHDRRMKRSDRAEINQFKTKSSKTKKALQDAIDEDISPEERKKASRKYVRREALDRAADFAVGGANIGANLGYGIGYLDNASKMHQGVLMSDNRNIMKGTLGGLAGGAAIGATVGGIRSARASKKTIERLRNSENKEKAKDKIRVARGEMTETEFVNKHGGRE